MKAHESHNYELTISAPPSLLIHIFKHQHVLYPLFIAFRKTTPSSETLSLLECAKQAIPKGKVSKIIAMDTKLMVNGVMFWALNEITEPLRRTNIRMIKILTYCAKKGCPCPRFRCAAKNTIHKKTCDKRIGNNLYRVFIK